MNRNTVIGVFDNNSDADRAISELHHAGFTNAQIGVAGREANAATTDKGTNTLAGAATGAAVGGGAGGLVALGVLAGVIPVIGPAIAAGTLGVILTNAVGGAAIAGLAGALIGAGVPEDEAKHYEGEFKSGRTIVTVKGDESQASEAWTTLRRNGAYNRENPRATKSAKSGNRLPVSV